MQDIHVENAEFCIKKRCLIGKVKKDGGVKRFLVPTNELFYRNIKWNLSYNKMPFFLEFTMNGFDAKIIGETSKQLILSIRQKQLEQIESLKVNSVYCDAKIIKLNYNTMFCELFNGIIVTVFQKELSAAHVGDIRDLFKVGQKIDLRLINFIQCEDGVRIHASRKRCYYNLQETLEKKLLKIGDVCRATITQRLNFDGVWVEITPGVAGILNAEPEEIDQLSVGQQVIVCICQLKPGKGFKLRFE